MQRNKDEKKVTYQAIVLLKGSDPVKHTTEMVMAGMTVLHQYNPKSNSYVGQYEAGEFTKHWDSWVKDNELRQEVFYADNIDTMLEVAYMAGDTESIPVNAFDEESTVLVLGPFSADRLDFFTKNYFSKA